MAAALAARCLPGLACRGASATWRLMAGRSPGNSVRMAPCDHLLYHGTLPYHFALETIGRCLAMPPRMPDYRQARPHEAFVANLAADAAAIRRALQAAWEAAEACHDWPAALTTRLAATATADGSGTSNSSEHRIGPCPTKPKARTTATYSL